MCNIFVLMLYIKMKLSLQVIFPSCRYLFVCLRPLSESLGLTSGTDSEFSGTSRERFSFLSFFFFLHVLLLEGDVPLHIV